MKSILLSAAVFGAALAIHAGPEAWLPNRLLTPEMMAALKPALDLSDDQEARMQAIITESRGQGAPLEQAVRDQQKALKALLFQHGTTPDTASAALTRLLEAEASVKQLQLRTLIQLRDILTPEQQEKAVKLAPDHLAESEDIKARVRGKAEKLRAAVESLGIDPTPAMSERGAEIEGLMKAGEWAAVDKALDKIIQESGADEPESTEEIDFSQYDAGGTGIEDLKARYHALEEKGRSIISIPLLRQLLKAKETFEEAKTAQDAEQIGRILTWAEQQLGKD